MLNDILANIRSYYDSFVALLPRLALALVVLLLLIWLASRVRSFAQRRLSYRMDDPLLARFIANAIGMVIVIMALLLSLQIVGLGNVAVGLLSTAGVGAFVVGFAFKDIGENFLAGIVLAFKRPFRIGDTVELLGFTGRVVALNLRDIQLKSSDGKDIFIPNSSVVKNPVINQTIDGYLREEFSIQLNHATDAEKAAASLQKMLDEAKEVLHEDGRMPEVVYGDASPKNLGLVVRYWTDTFAPTYPSTVVRKRLFDRAKRLLGNLVQNPQAPSATTEQKHN